MEFTSAQIDRIKELATMLTPVSDIAVLMDVDERRLRGIISDKSHPASIAYRKGRAERALQIRQNELELAEAGNIPVATTLLGLSSFPTGHPLWLGNVGMHCRQR